MRINFVKIMSVALVFFMLCSVAVMSMETGESGLKFGVEDTMALTENPTSVSDLPTDLTGNSLGIGGLSAGTLSVTVPYSKEDFYVFLCIGQSNMAGRASIGAQDEGIIPHVYLLNGTDQWEEAAAAEVNGQMQGFNRYSTVAGATATNGLNPAHTFSKRLTELFPDKGIGIVSNAIGGTDIESWLKDTTAGTNYYAEAVRRAKEAMKTGTLKGIIWHQGESDQSEYDLYLGRFSTLVSDLRTDLGISDLPVVAGQILLTKSANFNNMIMTVKDNIPYTDCVSSEGVGDTGDGTHFNSAGQRLIGTRYADKMYTLLTGLTPPGIPSESGSQSSSDGWEMFSSKAAPVNDLINPAKTAKPETDRSSSTNTSTGQDTDVFYAVDGDISTAWRSTKGLAEEYIRFNRGSGSGYVSGNRVRVISNNSVGLLSTRFLMANSVTSNGGILVNPDAPVSTTLKGTSVDGYEVYEFSEYPGVRNNAWLYYCGIMDTTNLDAQFVVNELSIYTYDPDYVSIHIENPDSGKVEQIPIPSSGSVSVPIVKKAVVVDCDGIAIPAKSITWSLSGATAGVSINENTGEISVSSSATSANIVVKAQYTENPAVYALKEIEIGDVGEPTTPTLRDEEIVLNDLFLLEFSKLSDEEPSQVTKNLSLPLRGENGSEITWESNKQNVIAIVDESGVVTRPTDKESEAVLLTATFTKGNAVTTREYYITVVGKVESGKVPYNDLNANPNKAADVSISASSLSGYPGENAIDGNESTAWISASGVTSPSIRFSRMSDAGRITGSRIRIKHDTTQGVTGWRLGSGNNTSSISTLYEPSSFVPENGWITIQLPTPLANSYLYYYATVASGTGNRAVLYEIMVYDPVPSYITLKDKQNTIAKSATKNISLTAATAVVRDYDGLEIKDVSMNSVKWEIIRPIQGVTLSDGGVFTVTSGAGTGFVGVKVSSEYDPAVYVEYDVEVVDLLSVSDAYAVQKDSDMLLFTDMSYEAMNKISSNLVLPSTGLYGSSIEWSSSNGAIRVDGGYGIVTRPINKASEYVKLTATIKKGTEVVEKHFYLTVIRTAQDILNMAVEKISIPQFVYEAITLMKSDGLGTVIQWETNDSRYITKDGKVNRPSVKTGNVRVVLNAVLTNSGMSTRKSYPVTVIKDLSPEATEVQIEALKLEFEDISNGQSANNVTSNLTFITSLGNGVTATWHSSKTNVVTNAGVVSRPQYENDSNITLEAVLSKGTETEKVLFKIRVPSLNGSYEPSKDAPSIGGSLGGSGVPSFTSMAATDISGTDYYDNSNKDEKAGKTFNDIDEAAWAKDYILKLLENSIVSGNENEEFEPNRSITRDEFVKMIIGAFSLLDETATSNFADVSAGMWSYPYISSAVNKGIIKGTSEATFGTGGLISRQDMATIAYRAATTVGISIEAINEAVSFTDEALIDDYARAPVAIMQSAGIVNGFGDGSFAPFDTATRAQAAKIICMLYEQL